MIIRTFLADGAEGLVVLAVALFGAAGRVFARGQRGDVCGAEAPVIPRSVTPRVPAVAVGVGGLVAQQLLRHPAPGALDHAGPPLRLRLRVLDHHRARYRARRRHRRAQRETRPARGTRPAAPPMPRHSAVYMYAACASTNIYISR